MGGINISVFFFFPPVSAQWEDKGDCSSTLLLSHYISTCRDPNVGKNVLRCHLNGPDIYETLLASCARAEKISKICWLTNSTSVWPGKLSNLFCYYHILCMHLGVLSIEQALVTQEAWSQYMAFQGQTTYLVIFPVTEI